MAYPTDKDKDQGAPRTPELDDDLRVDEESAAKVMGGGGQ
jgi:hypothetical protein